MNLYIYILIYKCICKSKNIISNNIYTFEIDDTYICNDIPDTRKVINST